MKKQPVAIFDWDGTLREGFSLIDWMFFLSKKNIVKLKALNDLDILFKQFERKEIIYADLADKANKIYAEALQGISKKEIQKKAKEFVKTDIKIFNFVKSFMEGVHRKNAKNIIISGAPVELLEEYAVILPIDMIYGLKLEIKNNVYTGKIIRNTAKKEVKKEIVNELKNEYKIKIGIGDSESDIPIIENAEIPIIVENKMLKEKLKEVLFIPKSITYEDLKKNIKKVEEIKGIIPKKEKNKGE
jgi:HAD superfamily phosphoserine phosphatase-like hydrolase